MQSIATVNSTILYKAHRIEKDCKSTPSSTKELIGPQVML